MAAYNFSALPTGSTVSAGVTLLVCAWFAMAAGAILTDNHSEANIVASRTLPTSPNGDLQPDAHFSIVVEARRPEATL